MKSKLFSHLLGIDLESWVFSDRTNARNLSVQKLRELDDGYTLASLKFLFKILRKSKQKVTFFLIFKLEDLYPGIIDKILQEGHEVAWHGYTHTNLTSKEVLLKELTPSKKYLKKYKIKGFQAPQIMFFKRGYKILKDFGFLYSSSIYGNSDKIYNLDGIFEIPVSTSRKTYDPPEDKILFPSSMTFKNIIKFGIPFGSSYFWSILNKPYYGRELKWHTKNRKKVNLFVHNWQLVDIKSDTHEYKSDKESNDLLSNPFYLPYALNVQNVFEFLLKNYSFQRFDEYVKEIKEKKYLSHFR